MCIRDSFAFAVACASLIFSIAIYYAFSFTYKHVLASETKSKDDTLLGLSLRKFVCLLGRSLIILTPVSYTHLAAALTMGTAAAAQTMIQKNDIKVENHLMTPEALWACLLYTSGGILF